MRLFASVGAHALAVGCAGAAVLTASDAHLTPYQFPARAMPIAAGAAAGQFVVALPARSRSGIRRAGCRSAGCAAAARGDHRGRRQRARGVDDDAAGAGADRRHPARQSRPAEGARAARADRARVAGIRAATCSRASARTTGRRLRGRSRRPHAPARRSSSAGIDRAEAAGLVVGRVVGVLAAQARRPLVLAAARRGAAGASAVRAPAAAADGDARRRAAEAVDAGRDGTGGAAPAAPRRRRRRAAAARGRRRVEHAARVHARHGAGVVDAAGAGRRAGGGVGAAGRRCRALARRCGGVDARGVLPVSIARRRRPARRRRARRALRARAAARAARSLLLYGAHLCGDPGAAPVDVARVCDRAWDEALGRGELAERGSPSTSGRASASRRRSCARSTSCRRRRARWSASPGAVALLGPCVVVEPRRATRRARRALPRRASAARSSPRATTPIRRSCSSRRARAARCRCCASAARRRARRCRCRRTSPRSSSSTTTRSPSSSACRGSPELR